MESARSKEELEKHIRSKDSLEDAAVYFDKLPGKRSTPLYDLTGLIENIREANMCM